MSELVTLAEMPQYNQIKPAIHWDVGPHSDVDLERIVLDTGSVSSWMRLIGVDPLTVTQHSGNNAADASRPLRIIALHDNGEVADTSRISRGTKATIEGASLPLPIRYCNVPGTLSLNRKILGEQMMQRILREQDPTRAWAVEVNRALKQGFYALYVEKLRRNDNEGFPVRGAGTIFDMSALMADSAIAAEALVSQEISPVNISILALQAGLDVLSAYRARKQAQVRGHNPKWLEGRISLVPFSSEIDRLIWAGLRTLFSAEIVGIKR